MGHYQASVHRESDWWVVVIDGIGATQTRRLAEIDSMARDLVAAVEDLDDIDDVRVDVDVQPHPLPCPPWCEHTTHEPIAQGAVVSYRHHGVLKLATGTATLTADDYLATEGPISVAPQRVLFVELSDSWLTLADAERITQALRSAELPEGRNPE